MPPDSAIVLEADHLTRRFGRVTAVEDVSFQIRRGEIVGMLGPNGAGKTTTLRMVAGFLCPTAGDARVAGRSVTDDPIGARRRLGYLPEHAALYPEMRAGEYLRFRAELKGVPRARIAARVDEAAELCGVRPVLRRLIGELSKGYRQRVALADALVHEPQLLVLDEPTLGLDPNQIRQVRELIRALAERHTVLISSHILPEIEMTCHRVLILHRGRLLADGPVAELAAQLHRRRRIMMQVRAPAAEVRRQIAMLTGTSDVLTESLADGWLEVQLEATAGDDLRPSLAALAAARGWPLRELRREELSLEQVFLALTGADGRGGPR
ncbi:MAG: ABC transporter ATP-binding protein [Kiritimatiellae bacterium]|nr:ABC transporter ATP-binding protein [Kiritimatiellia bacterium]